MLIFAWCFVDSYYTDEPSVNGAARFLIIFEKIFYTHAHTHTYIYIYMYMFICIYVYVYMHICWWSFCEECKIFLMHNCF